MNARSSLLISCIAAAVLFGVGYAIVLVIPGGGTVDEADFTAFYVEDETFGTALALTAALLAAAWALIWFFAELRSRLPGSMLTRVGFAASVLGGAGLAIGGVLLFAPSGVQLNGEADYVGFPIAHTFAQAGLGAMLTVGMYSFAVAVVLFSLALRRSALVPSWLGIAGIVVGVLMFGSYIWAPGYLLPIWVLVVGIMATRSPAPAPAAAPAA